MKYLLALLLMSSAAAAAESADDTMCSQLAGGANKIMEDRYDGTSQAEVIKKLEVFKTAFPPQKFFFLQAATVAAYMPEVDTTDSSAKVGMILTVYKGCMGI